MPAVDSVEVENHDQPSFDVKEVNEAAGLCLKSDSSLLVQLQEQAAKGLTHQAWNS